MTMFAGQYEGKLDAKGRVVLPSRLKAALPSSNSNTLVVYKGFEPCLVLYSVPEWEKTFARAAQLDEFNKEFRSFQRNLFTRFTEIDLDGNGRFLVPKGFMAHADLDKDVIFLGLVNRIELWNPVKYEEQLLKDPDELAEKAQRFLADNSDNKYKEKE